MNINKRFIKSANWMLAGIITLLGFAGCDKIGVDEYGVLHVDYKVSGLVKGVVVNKETQKPIEGIRIGYRPEYQIYPMYGPLPSLFNLKSHVLTNAMGEFSFQDSYSGFGIEIIDNIPTLLLYVNDVDGEKNGVFAPAVVSIDYRKGETIGPLKEYTLNTKVELIEVATP